MFRLLAVLSSPVLLFALAPAAPVPKHLMDEPVLYFPTTVGTKWVCDRSSVKPPESKRVVSRVEGMMDGAVAVTVTDADDGTPIEKVLVSKQGLFLLERGGWRFNPPVCCLKLPLKPGEEWETTGTFGDHKIWFKHKVGTPAWVNVPAGKFKAIPVVEEMEINSRGGMWPQTDWYAPVVGCIKSTTPGGLNNVLKSFTPGKAR